MKSPDGALALPAWLNATLFNLGDTAVTPARLLGLVLIVIAVWWFASLLERLIRRTALRANREAAGMASVYAWSRVLRYAVWIVGTVAGLAYVGFDITSLALLGGAIGVGIGFGLQALFSNFVSGIVILLEGTLKVGDFVDLQSGVRGHVREIGMRYTRVTTNDDVDIFVPNSEFINGRVTNWTYENRVRRMRIPFGVAYGSDMARVKEAGLRAAKRVAEAPPPGGREPDVWLVKFGESSLDFELVVWIGPDRVTRPGNTEATYLWAIEDELRAAGIEIPFPQRDLHVRSGALRVRLEDRPGGA